MQFFKRFFEIIYKYRNLLFIFIFAFFAMSFFFSSIDGDVLWNYGFSYAISKGEIPYLDFNMIITPFYPMFNAIFLKIFSNNILVFYIINSFLITLMFNLLFKMFNYKTWILFLFLFFPLPAVVFPTYNMLLIFLVLLLIYLEKNDGNDYLIGIILGISILTKQTVGCFLCLPSLFYFYKNCKKIGKRITGCCIICSMFFLYLLFCGTLEEFFSLCFLGMLDFHNANTRVFNIFFFLTLLLDFIIVYKIVKDKRNINNWYVLCFSIVNVPLFDVNHFEYFLFLFLALFLEKLTIHKKQLCYCSLLFSLCYIFIFFYNTVGFSISYPNHYNNFEVRLLYNKNGEFAIRDRLNKYINKNKNNNIVLFSSEAYFYKITNEMDINYFDLLNKGNHGYNGTKRMINKIREMPKGTKFILDYGEFKKKDRYQRQQINKEIMKYVIDNGKLIDEFDCFRVYKLAN